MSSLNRDLLEAAKKLTFVTTPLTADIDSSTYDFVPVYLPYIEEELQCILNQSITFGKRQEPLVRVKPVLSDKLFQEMSQIYKQYLKEKIPSDLQFWILYRLSCLNPSQILPTSLHKMILKSAIVHQTITNVCILREHVFQYLNPNQILDWIILMLEDLGLSEQVLITFDKMRIFTNWDRMCVYYDAHLYSALIGNLMSKVKNTNLESFILRDFGEFYFLLLDYEGSQYSVLEKIFTFQDKQEVESLGLRVGDCTTEFDLFDEQSEILSHEISQTIVQLVLNDEMQVIAKALDCELTKFTGKKLIIHSEKQSLFYKLCKAMPKETDPLLETNQIFNLFSFLLKTFNLETLFINYLKFIRQEVFCVTQTGEFWDGVKWVQITEKYFPETNSILRNAMVGLSKRPMDPPSRSVHNTMGLNYYVNNFDNGLCRYDWFNIYEISSPAVPPLTRNLSQIHLPDAILYSPMIKRFRNQLLHQFKLMLYLHDILDMASINSLIFYGKWYNSGSLFSDHYYTEISNKSLETLDLDFWLRAVSMLKFPLIKRIFDRINLIVPNLFPILINLAIQLDSSLLVPGNFNKIFFDQNVIVANDLADPIDCYIGEAETLQAPDDPKMCFNSMKDVSLKLQRGISRATKIQLQVSSENNVIRETPFYTKWVDIPHEKQINRVSVFELVNKLTEITKRDQISFDWESITEIQIRQLTTLGLLMIIGRPKNISSTHPCRNSVLADLFASRGEILSLLRGEFPKVDLEFRNSDERVVYFTNFMLWNNKAQVIVTREISHNYVLEINYALIWIFQFSNFKLDNTETIAAIIKYMEMPGNLLKKFLYLYGASNSGKSQFGTYVGAIYFTGHPAQLSPAAFAVEKSELNNALIPVTKIYVGVLDEFTTISPMQINRIVSERPMSYRQMITQKFKILHTYAKIVLMNNVQVRFPCNQGIITRLVGIWMKHRFLEVEEKGQPIDPTNPKASMNWAVQRITNTYTIGIEDSKVVNGLFILIRQVFPSFYSNETMIKLVVSEQYILQTRRILQTNDPYLTYILYQSNNSIKFKTDDEAIEYYMKKYNQKWTIEDKQMIMQRLEEEKLSRMSSKSHGTPYD